jgi:hypothetical protein
LSRGLRPSLAFLAFDCLSEPSELNASSKVSLEMHTRPNLRWRHGVGRERQRVRRVIDDLALTIDLPKNALLAHTLKPHLS